MKTSVDFKADNDGNIVETITITCTTQEYLQRASEVYHFAQSMKSTILSVKSESDVDLLEANSAHPVEMTHSGYFILKCSHCNTVIAQCRCPDLNKETRMTICASCKEKIPPTIADKIPER